MPAIRTLQSACLALSWLLGAPGQACEFSANNRWVLSFPTLNPTAPRTEIALLVDPALPSQGSTRVGFCDRGRPMVVKVRGELRLKHEKLEAYLPFSLDGIDGSFTSPGPREGVPLVIQGRIDGAAIRSAPPGRYVGRFSLEVSP